MFKLFDRVKFNTSSQGTGDVAIGSASSNAFYLPSEVGAADGDTVRYVINDGTDVEEGIGTIADSVTKLQRTTVSKSKVGGAVGTSKLNLSGTAVVALSASGSDILVPANNLADVDDADAARANLGVETSSAATKSDQQDGSSDAVAVTPAHQQDHDSAAKAWCNFSGTATGTHGCNASYNVSSVTRTSAGNYQINFTVPFADTNYVCIATAEGSPPVAFMQANNGANKTTSSILISALGSFSSTADANTVNVVCFGRQ